MAQITVDAIRELKEQRQNIFQTEMVPLRDIAAQRALTAEEQQTWDRVDGDIGERSARIAQLERAFEQERDFAVTPDATPEADVRETGVAADLRSVLVEGTQRSMNVGFNQAEITRALASGTPSAGGNTIPAATFLARLTEPLRDQSSVLQAGATVIVTESGEDLKWPTVATHGAAVADVAESANRAGTDPTFGLATIKAYEHSQLIVVPRRLVEDSAIDIEAFVARKIGENVGYSIGAKLAIGAGTTTTEGIATAATSGKTGVGGVGGAPSFDDIIDVLYSVAAPYRNTPTSAFIVADAALPGLRKVKSALSGEYVWQPSVQVGQPDTILGKALFPDAHMEYGVGKKSILFGDISKYIVRFVGGIEIARSEEAYFASNGVGFRGILRADGLLEDTAAVKAFTGGAVSA